MASSLRPRLDATVVLAGVAHEVSTSLRDTVSLKAERGGQLSGDGEDGARLVHLACQRTGVFTGSWDDFLDACDDIEIREPPPLAAAASSPDSSPRLPDRPGSPPTTSPASNSTPTPLRV